MTNGTVVELRQYTLHPGSRNTLVDLFEEHFLEGQEKAGMSIDTADVPESLVALTIHHLSDPVDDGFRSFFDTKVRPALQSAGAEPVAELETEYAPNGFPALPVRTGEHVFVWVSVHPDEAAFDAYRARLAASPEWTGETLPELTRRTLRTEILRLAPARRSLLR